MKSKINSYKKILEKKLLFKYLLGDLSSPSIYAFVNEKDKKILIQASSEPMASIGRQVSDLGNRIHSNRELKKDRKHLRLIILQTNIVNLKLLKIEKLKFIMEYIKDGYTLYNKEKIPTYNIRKYFNGFNLEVQLISKGKRVISIRDNFKSDSEANKFISENSVISLLRLVET